MMMDLMLLHLNPLSLYTLKLRSSSSMDILQCFNGTTAATKLLVIQGLSIHHVQQSAAQDRLMDQGLHPHDLLDRGKVQSQDVWDLGALNNDKLQPFVFYVYVVHSWLARSAKSPLPKLQLPWEVPTQDSHPIQRWPNMH